MMNITYFSLGTNLGNRLKNIENALICIRELGDIQKLSSVYNTKPWNVNEKQPDYLNQNCQLITELSPQELINRTKNIEINLGRTNKRDKTSRIIDIDLLLYGDLILNSENLVIPHPQMTERAFVMIPLAEIVPDLTISGYKKSVKEIANGLDSSLVEIFLES